MDSPWIHYDMPKALQVDKELIKQMFIQGIKMKEIERQTGVSQKTVSKWSIRYNWCGLTTRTQEMLAKNGRESLTMMVAGDLAERSKLIREQLSDEIAAQMQVLKSKPPKTLGQLASSNGHEGRASVVKRIADAAAIVHDWDAESMVKGVVATGALRRFDEGPGTAPIDVQEVKPDSAQ